MTNTAWIKQSHIRWIDQMCQQDSQSRPRCLNLPWAKWNNKLYKLHFTRKRHENNPAYQFLKQKCHSYSQGMLSDQIKTTTVKTNITHKKRGKRNSFKTHHSGCWLESVFGAGQASGGTRNRIERSGRTRQTSVSSRHWDQRKIPFINAWLLYMLVSQSNAPILSPKYTRCIKTRRTITASKSLGPWLWWGKRPSTTYRALRLTGGIVKGTWMGT